MMMWYGNNLSGWGYGLMFAGMVIFWVLVVVAIVALLATSADPIAIPRICPGRRRSRSWPNASPAVR